jgi:hypothetical protein
MRRCHPFAAVRTDQIRQCCSHFQNSFCGDVNTCRIRKNPSRQFGRFRRIYGSYREKLLSCSQESSSCRSLESFNLTIDYLAGFNSAINLASTQKISLQSGLTLPLVKKRYFPSGVRLGRASSPVVLICGPMFFACVHVPSFLRKEI